MEPAKRRVPARMLLVACMLCSTGCGRSALHPEVRVIEQSAALSFGTVVVGQSVSGRVVLARDAQAARKFTQSFAPEDIEAPRVLALRAGERGELAITWKPQAPGPLDAAVLYSVLRDSPGHADPTWLRIELTGTAVAARTPDACTNCTIDAGTPPVDVVPRDPDPPAQARCPRGASGITCDDDNPCTLDTCVAGSCTRSPAMDGETCGTFDCKVGHFCGGGTCVAVDLSAQSEGMPCDDGDHCTEDGECRAGVCYASTEPRKPRILDQLDTYGEGVSDAATDGEVFVYVDVDRERIDIAERHAGSLEHRSWRKVPGVLYVLALGARRFLLRSTDGKVALLDARDPSDPSLTPLPHIAPKALPIPDGTTIISAGFGPEWKAADGVLLISAYTLYDDGDTTNGVQQVGGLLSVPVDPKQGGSRLLDVHAGPLAPSGVDRTFARVRFGDPIEAVGILQLDAKGKLVTSHALTKAEAEDLGCGVPFWVAASGRQFVTLSDEDDIGYSRICLWQIAKNPANGFELVRARKLNEHLHYCNIALDDQSMYVSCRVHLGRGWAGSVIKFGETVRYDLDDIASGDSALTFKDAELIGRASGTSKTAVEAGYLWTIGEVALAWDLQANGEPLDGKGFGRLNSVIAGKRGDRALVGGLASFGVVEVTDGRAPAIHFSDWKLHYPRTGEVFMDMRALRDGTRAASANAAMSYHAEPNVEEVTATLTEAGALQLDVAARSITTPQDTQAIAVTIDRTWLADGALRGWTPGDGMDPSVESPTSGDGTRLMRADASGARLVIGDAAGFVVIDPLMPDAVQPATIDLAIENFYTPAYRFQVKPEFAQVIAVDGNHVLAGSSAGVELHSLTFAHDAVKVGLPELDSTFPVTLPLAADGAAIASYVMKDGKARLVQLSYAEGELKEVAALQTDRRVLSVAPVGDHHWLLVTENGVQLADLACWPGEE